ncbi:MAG: hypothetical protein MRJ65_00410 [Candidatus Brocadiaceae bacterium]|nr:hypothetical protein [Candidatus Brocadiaceae bacterium]
MIKFTAIALFVCMCFYTAVNGDSIVLKDGNKDFPITIISVTDEVVKAVVLKKFVDSLNMQFSQTGNYPDEISVGALESNVKCKIKEITEDSVQIDIPTTAISSLRMSFHPEDAEETVFQIDTEKPETEKQKIEPLIVEKTTPQAHTDTAGNIAGSNIRTALIKGKDRKKDYRLKTFIEKTKDFVETEEIFSEEELFEEDEEAVAPDQKLIREIPKEEAKEKNEETLQETNLVTQAAALGSVEGMIVKRGKPLSDCQVKLHLLEKSGLLSKVYRPTEEAIPFETVTNKEGRYHFMNVAPGLYKLYWKPPAETTWVRRFKMEPDVIVKAGKTTKPDTIETLKRTLN